MITDKEVIYKKVYALIKKHGKGMRFQTDFGPMSTAKDKKPVLCYFGKHKVSIAPGRKPQDVYIAGVVMQKNYVSFYSMPMYSDAKVVPLKHPLLKRMRKGLSCINLTKIDDEMLAELDMLLKRGNAIYKKKGWI